MSGPGLIADYLGALSAQLPRPVVEELADGFEETYQRYQRLGLAPAAAAEAAVAEFGDPRLIVAGYARAHPARQAALRLLAFGPVVGSCWAVALVTTHAWTWPIPVMADIVPGLVLVTSVALLGVAALSTRYRIVARAGTAGCVGVMALDIAMIPSVVLVDPALSWVAGLAMTLSAVRLAFGARLLHPVLVRR